MKPKNNFFKWMAVIGVFTTFVSFSLVSPSVSAQEGTPPASTEMPTEIYTEEPIYYPTIVPTPMPDLGVQTTEQSIAPFNAQSLGESVSASGWSFPQNISQTESLSTEPSIAVDSANHLHIVWTELNSSGISDIYYKYQDEAGAWSSVVNVSKSNAFNSNNAQIITDSNGNAHIVWAEQDNDFSGDNEVYYSRCTGTTCTNPTNLSGPTNWDCGRFLPNLQDWSSGDPIIGIDENENLMVLWRAYEPAEITMAYSAWSSTDSPPTIRTGCLPYNAGIPNHVVGAARVVGGGTNDFRLVYENLPSSSPARIYYSTYNSNSFPLWVSNQIGEGSWPDIFLKGFNQAHATWCGHDGIARYWNNDISAVETITGAFCGLRVSVAVDANDVPHAFSNSTSQIYENIRYPEGWSEKINVSQSPNGAARQDVVADSNGNLHVVWFDGRDGNFEIYYSTKYDCTGVLLSPIAQAVSNEVNKDLNKPKQNFCGNSFEDLVILPPGEDAFERFHDLASEAKYEVDFTTMLWDEYIPELGNSAGRIFLGGVKELHSKVVNPNTADDYSEGVQVRILIGLDKNSLDFASFIGTPFPWEDIFQYQHARILEDLSELQIPLEDTNWKVEIALYNAVTENTYSHVKLMIVDGKIAISSGYNMQYVYLNGRDRRDMGVEVSGPIALDSLTVFDSLWSSAILCESIIDGECVESSVTLQRHPRLNNPISTGNDIVFSLYRDDNDKFADNAIVAAINSANSQVNIMQNRFVNSFILPMPYARAILDVLKKNNDEEFNVKLIVSGEKPELSLNKLGICNLKKRLANEEPSKLQYFKARSLTPSVHTKSLSIDNSFIIVGSQNFDVSAWLDFNYNLDLAEYSLGIESDTAADDFDGYFEDEWAISDDINCKADNVALQSEIDQAEAGSIIVIPAGIYTESVIINKPLTLVGANNQTIIQPVGNEPAFRITSSDVVIANMKISGGDGYGIELIDSSPSSLKDIQIYRVVFEENAQGGVLVQGLIPGSPMNYAIENNTFIGGGSGVIINMLETQAEKSFIRNNIFYSQLRFPIEILSENDSHVEYSFNVFDNCDLGTCTIYWRDIEGGVLNPLSTQHDNLFDLDPRFISAGDGAYQLSIASPAIDAGDPSMFHELYFDGNNDEEIRIDMGAFEYVPVTNLSPVVTAGADQTIELGNPVTITTTYTDEDNIEDHTAQISWEDGLVEDVSATVSAPNQGEVIRTHTYNSIGTYTVEICVIDLYGGVGCDTLQVNVTQPATQFTFTGFFQPVDNQPIINTVNAGRAIPIKFSLNGYQGLDIFTAGYPASVAVTCGTSAEDAIEQTVTAGGSSLSYDAATDQYTYVWKTDKAWANTCRTLVLKLSDGSYYRANFKFKK